jgi:hypothetical protein
LLNETEIDKWIGGLLAALPSLRVFAAVFGYNYREETGLSFIMKASDRASRLEYRSVEVGLETHHFKRFDGVWVTRDEAEFLSF